ncbi:MAG: translocation/assembly module TamB [Chitinophagaceae bacterium]|nr:translocation/assembly module TamB [Chitinophagaceae bacterium]
MTTFTNQFPSLKASLKILKITALSLLLLIVMTAVLIHLPPVQDILVKGVVHRLSKDLGTRVTLKHVHFTLLNKMNLEDLYIEDLEKDTLLFAGKLQVNITDWFFLKDQAEFKYIGLENAVFYLHRTDSVWNYQFLADHFSSPSPSKNKKQIGLLLNKMTFKNIRFKQRDEWRGQDLELSFKQLDLGADEINFGEKQVNIKSLSLEEPVFTISDYTGLRPRMVATADTGRLTNELAEVPFNAAGWKLQIHELTLHNGAFRSNRTIDRKVYEYFDAGHIHFYAINGTLKQVALVQDTLFAQLNLSTKERSGFTVESLSSDFRMQPGAMIFDHLDIKTPYSHLTHFYAMRYDHFDDDMKDFISKVKLEGRFSNSLLHSKDIAFFAPELKDWNKKIMITGTVTGPVEHLKANNFLIQSGKSSYLRGDIRMDGLPDLDSTYIDCKINDLYTGYADMVKLFPDLAGISQPHIEKIQRLNFKGRLSGRVRNFTGAGSIQTSLGDVSSNLVMKFPVKGAAKYSGKFAVDRFDIGTFLGVKQLGTLSFNGNIKGSGLKPETLNAELDGVFSHLKYNGYDYSNIAVNGNIEKKVFKGAVDINDPNVIVVLNGGVDFNSRKPEFNFFADIQRSNLKKMGFSKEDMNLIGKFDMNFNGNNIDDFLGSVSLFDVAVTKNSQTFIFDTLTLSSQLIDQQKILQLRNTEASAFLIGNFNIRELPEAVKQFLNKYYPTYIPPPEKAIKDQNFLFQLDVKNIDQYLGLINPALKGFNNSTIVGSLNSATNVMAISTMIPYAAYKNLAVQDFRLTGLGNMDSLQLTGVIGNTTVNDSLQFPESKISITSSNNISRLNISTAATQTINEARLSAQISNLDDGVKIHFDPSSIVLNEKTWKINEGGELTLSRSVIDAKNIKFSNGEQEISMLSKPSEVGPWDDIVVELKKVNIGDFVPFVLKEPRLEGMASGVVTIEDAFRNMYVSSELNVEQFRFENDSIGMINITAAWDGNNKKAKYEAISDNREYRFSIAGSYEIIDSLHQEINANANFDYTKIHFLEKYIGSVFGDIKGFATGNINVKGDVKNPDYIGSIDVKDAGLRVLYTRCYYTFDSARIVFTPGKIDFGTIPLYDTLPRNGKNERNTAILTGNLQHANFDHFAYNISVNTNRLLLLNTTRSDNDLFYGKAIGKASFRFNGSEDNMRMNISGEPVDSSTVYITSSSSKESANADYIVWKQYGREMNIEDIGYNASQLNIDLNLTANNYIRMFMILDEVTGDIIEATGNGTLKMHTGTSSPFTINGKYTIDRGFYRFSFQEIFKKPFELLPNEGSYIRWDGDPYKAEINIRAKYLANDVKLSSLYADQAQVTDPEVSRLRSERTDVDVLCTLSGSLNKPDIHFDIALAANSDVKNSQRLLGDLQRINSDDNEKNKQVAYLIVFRSFAPIGQYNVQQTDATTFAFNTISEYISGYLTSSLKTLLYNIFKDPSLSVNFNYTRASIDPSGTGAYTDNTVNLTRDNISLQFIKSLLNDKLVISFGSDFNFVSSGSQPVINTGNTNFLFLPDITAEYKITPDGKFRISFFYRSNFDVLSTTGKRNRAGGSISFRTEFDSEHIKRKKQQTKDKEAIKEDDSTMLH